eukprot:COSAG01_NODE_59087_length_302_cov_0.768473_1_plen_68_part_10
MQAIVVSLMFSPIDLLAGDVGSWVREAALLTGRQLLWLSVTTSAATDAAAVSHFCACIGSPCLRHCGH